MYTDSYSVVDTCPVIAVKKKVSCEHAVTWLSGCNKRFVTSGEQVVEVVSDVIPHNKGSEA